MPIPGIVRGGRHLGRGILADSVVNKNRHRKHPGRVLFPRKFAYLCWVLVVMWLVLTTIGWVAFDEASDRGDLALRWAFYPFGIVGVVGLLMYYNCYAEAHDDHVAYRTWLRRTHRIDYADIVAYQIVPGQDFDAGLRLWTASGKKKLFQLPIYDMRKTLEYVRTHDVENRTKKKTAR